MLSDARCILSLVPACAASDTEARLVRQGRMRGPGEEVPLNLETPLVGSSHRQRKRDHYCQEKTGRGLFLNSGHSPGILSVQTGSAATLA